MDTQRLAKLAASWIAVAGIGTMQPRRWETTPERTRGSNNAEVVGLTDPSATRSFGKSDLEQRRDNRQALRGPDFWGEYLARLIEMTSPARTAPQSHPKPAA